MYNWLGNPQIWVLGNLINFMSCEWILRRILWSSRLLDLCITIHNQDRSSPFKHTCWNPDHQCICDGRNGHWIHIIFVHDSAQHSTSTDTSSHYYLIKLIFSLMFCKFSIWYFCSSYFTSIGKIELLFTGYYFYFLPLLLNRGKYTE